jgi:hypothetical protein
MADEIEVAPETQPPPQPPPPVKGGGALVAIGDHGIMLRNLDDLLRFARLAVSQGAAPKGMTEGGAALAIQAGLERGLGPMWGLQAAVIINGVLSWRGWAAAALIQNGGRCRPGTLRFWHEGEGLGLRGVAVAWRRYYAEADRREFTIADARTARLWGKAGPWQEYPGRQLMWRALGFLAKDVFPDELGGFPLAEEAQDFEPAQAARMATEQKTSMLPPPSRDPLLDVLDIGAAAPPAPEPAPPFATHEDADRAIAEAERRNDGRLE